MSKINLFAQIISKLDRSSFKSLVKEKKQTSIKRDIIVGHIWFQCSFVSLQKVNQCVILAMDKNLLLATWTIWGFKRRHQNQQVIELITNQMSWTANTISELYRSRWQIEIFFREIKQLLHIKSFIGTSENAVMIQIWTALITILVLKYLKALARYGWRLSNWVAFIRLNIFVKIDLQKWLDKPFEEPPEPMQNYIQGVLFWNCRFFQPRPLILKNNKS